MELRIKLDGWDQSKDVMVRPSDLIRCERTYRCNVSKSSAENPLTMEQVTYTAFVALRRMGEIPVTLEFDDFMDAICDLEDADSDEDDEDESGDGSQTD